MAIGGANEDGSLHNKVEILGRNSWTAVVDFPETAGVADIAVVSDQENDKIYALGGHNGDDNLQGRAIFYA